MTGLRFRLNPRLDIDAMAAAYARRKRLHIPDFLIEDDAKALHAYLKSATKWLLIFNQGEKLFELDRNAQAALTSEQREHINLAVHRGARAGFQFLYESIRVPDGDAARRKANSPLERFTLFLSSEPVLRLLRRITAADDIAFADAQATAYGLGHFLTVHDDDVAGKNRRAAYVFNLTPNWRSDWGGLLQFLEPGGHIERGYTPTFNALNIFNVPQPHSVSMVAPFAPFRRYSITGWLRAGNPPL